MILNQITIPCLDYSASVAFYEALGMVQIVEAPPRYARFESPDGSGATLSLHTVSPPVGASAGSGTVIYFAFFLGLPIISKLDSTKPVPERVTDAH